MKLQIMRAMILIVTVLTVTIRYINLSFDMNIWLRLILFCKNCFMKKLFSLTHRNRKTNNGIKRINLRSNVITSSRDNSTRDTTV